MKSRFLAQWLGAAALLTFLLGVPARPQAGTLVQFHTPLGDWLVELYDSDKPVTVQNFLSYVDSGAYSNSYIHRCEPQFVIQGGGHFASSNLLVNIGSPFTSLPVLTTNLNYADLIYTDISRAPNLALQVSLRPDGSREIVWNGCSNLVHYVEFTTSLPPSWQPLTSTNSPTTAMRVIDLDTHPVQRFYRVRIAD